MASRSVFESRNQVKLNLGDIYNQPDPRHYFNTLEPLDYMIPQNAKPVFESVFRALRAIRNLHRVTVLDLGCSYGINAALLKFHLTMEELYEHYGARSLGEISRQQLLHLDTARLKRRNPRSSLRFVGVDAASEAIRYATEAGLLDDGVVADLESAPPGPAATAKMAQADIIITTGCVGYITENTFARIFDARSPDRRLPWVASFVLRMFPYDDVIATLARHGLVTEKFAGHTFVQRSFASKHEQSSVLENLDRMGIDPSGKEAAGLYHAEFFLSRPRDEAIRLPIQDLLAATFQPEDRRPAAMRRPKVAHRPGNGSAPGNGHRHAWSGQKVGGSLL